MKQCDRVESCQLINLLISRQKRAPPVVEIETTESVESGSLVDVDSESVHTVPSDFKSQESK